jgi:signal transduction histidine kinase/CheY-like chemotaxis protein
MDMFVPDDEVARLDAMETTIAQDDLPAQLWRQLSLAWHLRQRDSQRAIKLCDQILRKLRKLRKARLPLATRHPFFARIRLITGEFHWLFSNLTRARKVTARALQQFQCLGDQAGLCDGYWLMSRISNENAYFECCSQFLQQAQQSARLSMDLMRIAYIDGESARFQAFDNFAHSKLRWEAPLQTVLAQTNPPIPAAATSVIHFYFGTSFSLSGDYGHSASHFIQCYELSIKYGQIHIAIIASGNTANTFCELNDYQSALEWGQRSLDLAQSRAWPYTLCFAKAQLAQALRHLKQHDAAQQLLEQSLFTTGQNHQSRNTLVTLIHLGDLALDKQDFPKAQAHFQLALQHSTQPNQFDVSLDGKRGLATALSWQNQGLEALTIARNALAEVEALLIRDEQIKLLQLLAEIHTRHQIPLDSAQTTPHAALHYLQQARAIADSIEGYIISGELLDALAAAHAAAGEYNLAYQVSLEANAAREKSHTQSAINRAIAMQVRFNTERAQAESEYHRQLAASEARRAQLLQQTSTTLSQLSLIGQELTAQLNIQSVLHSLNQHIHQLLDVAHFSIYLMTPDGQYLSSALSVEAGHELPARMVAIDAPHANSARAVRERREIVVDWAPDQIKSTRISGHVLTLSELFYPLMIEQRVLGVMTVQSTRRHAYGEREQLIFRTLCAYGAIALANARANLSLQENALQLDLAKKKAEQATHLKSAFLANMSHEIRTPMNAVIGLAHLVSGTPLSPKQATWVQKIHSSGLSLLGILNDILDLSKIEAGKLDIEATSFNLDDVLQHVADVTCQKASEKNLEYLFYVPPGMPRQFIGDPLRLGQILINLVNNAIKFCDQGSVMLGCTLSHQNPQQDAQILFTVRDSGIGMNAEQCQRLFQAFQQAEPSTSRLYGGTGLGLSISQQLVQLMGGQIRVDSSPGKGSCFYFCLSMPIAGYDGYAQYAPAPIPPAVQQASCLVLGPKRLGRTLLIKSLQALCRQICAVENEDQAFHQLQQAVQGGQPYTFLFFGDPGSGASLCERLKQAQLVQPHVIMVSHVEQANEHPCIDQIVFKPLIFSRLRQTLINCFPVEPNQASVVGAAPPPPPQSGDYPEKKFRVLVAEDNEINQQIAIELLAEQGVQVDIAIDGQHLLNRLRAVNAPDYQLIFMDLEMPVMDGLNATRIIRQDSQFDAIPIIAMSAHALVDIQHQCLADGMQDFLPKPIHPDRIRHILQRWLPAAH